MNDPLGLINQSSGGVRITPHAQPDRRAANGPDFKDVLMENIKQVNAMQQDAERAIEDLGSGRRTDMANVMIAKQKADTAFKMLQQVRNKLMDAYEEVKQMRV